MSDTVLARWKDRPAKKAIVSFVTSATTPGPAFIDVADRIATFDNDGTLWVEQPLPPQFDFVFGHWAEEIKADRSLAGQQPYKAIIEKDPAFFAGVATQDPDVVATTPQGVWPILGGHHTRGVRCAGAPLAPDRHAAEAGSSLRRTGLQADARAVRLPQGQRVPGVRLLGWWPRLHAGVRRGDLRSVVGQRIRTSA